MDDVAIRKGERIQNVESIRPRANVLIDLLEVGAIVGTGFEAAVFFRDENVIVTCDRFFIKDRNPIHRDRKFLKSDVELKRQHVEARNIGHHAETNRTFV